MKQLFIFLLFLGIFQKTVAQNIVGYQYWYDTNFANQTLVNFSGQTELDLNTFFANSSTLAPGLHNINFRAKNSDGKWSIVTSEQFLSRFNLKVNTFQYWIDNDFAHQSTATLIEDQNYILTSNLNTANVGYGPHKLNFRFRDTSGKWSIVSTEYFFKSTAGSQLSYAEYWIDSNFNNRQQLTFSSNNTVFIDQNILTSNLDEKLHTFSFRMKDQSGKWSVVTSSYFVAQSLISGYEYWFDSNYTTKKSVAITPTNLLTDPINLDISAISPGVHQLNFRAKTSSGKYSTAISQNISVLVNPIFSQVSDACNGEAIMPLQTTSNNNIVGTWSPALNNLATTTYTFNPNPGQYATSNTTMTIIVGNTTTWNGSNWSNGTPTAGSKAIIAGNYSEPIDLEACTLEVSNSAVVNVPSGYDFYVSGPVRVAPTANLNFSNNSNLLQTGVVNNNVGDIISKREASMRRLDYLFWSSPVALQNLLTFSPQTLTNRFYTFDENSNSFLSIVPSSNVFETAKGYSIRASNFLPTNGSQVVVNNQFFGKPNSGDISIPVTNSGFGKGYNLLGNPYPSTIDALAFLITNPGTIYFWTHQSQGAGISNYATFTTAGSVAATAGGPQPNGKIQTGQGFMFETATTRNAIFSNEMRIGNNENQFYKSITDKNRFWLNLNSPTTTFNQILIGYMSNATQGIDVAFDGKIFGNPTTAIYSRIDNEDFVIQAKGLPFLNSDIINLGFKAAIAGNYSIEIDHLEGLFNDNQDIFLKDHFTGSETNLKLTNYSFSTAEGTFNDRFEIIYSSNPLSASNTFDPKNAIIFAQNHELHIQTGLSKMENLKVYDIRGRLIYEQNYINQNQIILKNLKAQEQVLIVKIFLDNQTFITKKVVY